jgi:hypothetical protein
MPWALSLGGEADLFTGERSKVSLTGSVKYSFWSAYRDRHGNRPTDNAGLDAWEMDAASVNKRGEAPSPVMRADDLAWKDTLSATVGARYAYRQARGYIDLAYTPSPVPEQIGRTNYVDNDRIGMLLGADVGIDIGSLRVRPGFQLSAHRLLRRHNTKDDTRLIDELPDGANFSATHDPVPGAAGLQTNNPGWPGFASQGWLLGGAFTLQVPL